MWVRKWVCFCEIWQRVKPSPSLQAPLSPLLVATEAWHSVSLDFVFGLPTDAQDLTGILLIFDRLSKMSHLASVAVSITSKEKRIYSSTSSFNIMACPPRSFLIVIHASPPRSNRGCSTSSVLVYSCPRLSTPRRTSRLSVSTLRLRTLLH